MLLRSLEVKPRPTSLRQSRVPLARSRQRATSFFDWLSREETKTRFCQMMGVPEPGPGMGVDQARFLFLSRVSGRLVAGLEPLKAGPRHWGQLAAPFWARAVVGRRGR